jgi:hypothetical protein
MEEKKNPLKSKTLWVNLIVAVVALLGKLDDVPADTVVMALTSLNVLLRLVTKKPLFEE